MTNFAPVAPALVDGSLLYRFARLMRFFFGLWRRPIHPDTPVVRPISLVYAPIGLKFLLWVEHMLFNKKKVFQPISFIGSKVVGTQSPKFWTTIGF
jgi:hypothetical protein